MKIKTFPQVVFVSVYTERNGEQWLNTSVNKEEALGDERQVRVGIYKLVEIQEVKAAAPLSRKVKSRSTQS